MEIAHSLLSLFLLVIYNFFPGFVVVQVFSCFKEKCGKRFSVLELILYSFFVSIIINIFIVHFFKYMQIKITPPVSLMYLLLFLILFFIILCRKKFEFGKAAPAKLLESYEKYFLVICLIWYLILISFNIFSPYIGDSTGDGPKHVAIITASIENNGLVDNYPYSLIDAPILYPQGYHALFVFPLVLIDNSDALSIARSMHLFSRLFFILIAITIFLCADFFTGKKKQAFYAGFFSLFLGYLSINLMFWPGYSPALTRLIGLCAFLFLWQIILDKSRKEVGAGINYPFLAFSSLLAATGITIRPDIAPHLFIALIAIFSFVFFQQENKWKIIKVLLFFGILCVLFSLILYLPYVRLYLSSASSESLEKIIESPLLSRYLSLSYLCLMLPIALLAIFSIRIKELSKITALALCYLVIIPILILSKITFFSSHLLDTITIPLCILAAFTWCRHIEKRKISIFLLPLILILFFSFITFQHTKPDFNIYADEVIPILWMRENLDHSSSVFYIYGPHKIKKYENAVWSYFRYDDWISPIAKVRSLGTFSFYNKYTCGVVEEFSDLTKAMEKGAVSKKDLERFFKKYRITNIVLTPLEYEAYNQKYFSKLNVLYNDDIYYILEYEGRL